MIARIGPVEVPYNIRLLKWMIVDVCLLLINLTWMLLFLLSEGFE